MAPHSYTEDQLAECLAVRAFAVVVWYIPTKMNAPFGTTSTFQITALSKIVNVSTVAVEAKQSRGWNG